MALVMARRILKCRRQRHCSALALVVPRPPAHRWILPAHSSETAFSARPSFGIAFDIDGVLLQGGKLIDGAPQALRQLYDDGRLKVPFIFLTNGGGVPEIKKAAELSLLLGVEVLESQVLLGHTPFKKLVDRYGVVQALAIGKGEPCNVLSGYGFKNVMSLDEYAFEHDHIDPLRRFKPWALNRTTHTNQEGKKKIEAIFVVSDPIDWGGDIQVLCDVLRSGGEPTKESGPQPPLFFAADDFLYQSLFPIARFGMGAFRLALESIFIRLTGKPLVYTSFGKPQPSVYKDAERTLQQLATQICSSHRKVPIPEKLEERLVGTSLPAYEQALKLKTTYMIGDNPNSDIRGAKEAGTPWYSILVRTGCFRGKDNDENFPADKVVDNVEEAVHFILQREHVC